MKEFLTYVALRPRTYGEAMTAWRSSCPRHTVWEDALVEGLIQVGIGTTVEDAPVTLTPQGRMILDGYHTHANRVEG
ncbi:MAG: hypothetical protein FJY97_14855 [candidate division Zixibacteria bacterium]|nr:hypothetical protein [candidate division Zixibacteria bacterium]